MTPTTTKAATVLQKAWRHHWRFARTPMLVKTLTKTMQLNTQYVRSIEPFSELVPFLKNEALVQKLEAVLQRFVWAALARHAERPSFEIQPRVVLTAFMFAFRPGNVLIDLTSPVNQKMVEISKSMLAAFEAIALPMAEHNVAWGQLPSSNASYFYDQLESYMEHFYVWRRTETQRLKPKLMQNLETLQLMRETIPHALVGGVVTQEIKRLRTIYKNTFGDEEMELLDAELEKRRIERCITVIVKDSYDQLHHEVVLNPKFKIDDLDIRGPLLPPIDETRAHRYRILAQVNFIRAHVPELADIEKHLFQAWNLVEAMMERALVVLHDGAPQTLRIADAPSPVAALASSLRQCIMLIAQKRMNSQIATMYTQTTFDSCVAYEHQQFEEMVIEGKLKLDETTRWLTAACPLAPHHSIHGDYAFAVGQLVQHLPCFPEVFDLDTERLQRLHCEFRVLAALCAYYDATGPITADLEYIHKYNTAELTLQHLPMAAEKDSLWCTRLARAIRIRILSPQRHLPVRVARRRVPPRLRQSLHAFMDEIARMASLNYKVYGDDLYTRAIYNHHRFQLWEMELLQTLEQTLLQVYDESRQLHHDAEMHLGQHMQDKTSQQLYYILHFVQNLTLEASQYSEEVRATIARHRQDTMIRRLQAPRNKRRQDVDLLQELEHVRARVIQLRIDFDAMPMQNVEQRAFLHVKLNLAMVGLEELYVLLTS